MAVCCSLGRMLRRAVMSHCTTNGSHIHGVLLPKGSFAKLAGEGSEKSTPKCSSSYLRASTEAAGQVLEEHGTVLPWDVLFCSTRAEPPGGEEGFPFA